jgi:hypothetical protein
MQLVITSVNAVHSNLVHFAAATPTLQRILYFTDPVETYGSKAPGMFFNDQPISAPTQKITGVATSVDSGVRCHTVTNRYAV